MSVNIVPEHALPKSFFFEEELSSSTGRRMASEPARTLRAELSEFLARLRGGRGGAAPRDQKRATTLITLRAVHWPPRGPSMSRSFSARAIPFAEVTLRT